ncbi:MAG: hypothetical protein ACYDHW_09170 [Syntrophorhabdaceae bacterium]
MPVFAKTELKPENILSHVDRIYRDNFERYDLSLVCRVLHDVIDLFNGMREGFHGCDTTYHDLYHTLQTVPPFVEIVGGWNKSGAKPHIPEDLFNLGIIGVLLHDTGYIREKSDNTGTGAKYTLTHVLRSIDFADKYLGSIGLPRSGKTCVLTIIQCTGVTLDTDIIFHSDEEKIIGYSLGTADLLGQMSSPDYLEMLPILYKEFAESYRFSGAEKIPGKSSTYFGSAEELIKSTPEFYENVALKRFRMMGSMERYISYHYEGSYNPYMAAIEANIETIRKNWK